MKNPWDTRPSQDPMLLAVGRGIQAFSKIEQYLASIYAEFWRDEDWEMSLIALDAAIHLDSKVRVVLAVAELRLDEDALKVLKKLCADVRARAQTRNKLAHWTTEYWTPPNVPLSVDLAPLVEVRLLPAFLTKRNMGYFPTDTLQTHEIENFVNECVELTGRMINFFAGIANWNQKIRIGQEKFVQKIGCRELAIAAP